MYLLSKLLSLFIIFVFVVLFKKKLKKLLCACVAVDIPNIATK